VLFRPSFPREEIMPFVVVKPSRWFVVVALFVFVGIGSGTALAQPPKQLGSSNEVEQAFRRFDPVIREYLAGNKQAVGPNVMEATDAATAAARWFVWRLTHFSKRDQGDREYAAKIVRNFKSDFMDAATRPEYTAQNKAFMQIFNQQMIVAMKELLALDFKTYTEAQINGCLMLPILAQSGDDTFGNYLVELLKDAKLHDALRVHVLKGLRSFFAARPPFLDEDAQKVNQQDAERVAAVMAFVVRPTPKDLSPEELEAFRFIRREGIKALAQTRMPAEVVDKTGVKTPAALVLMKLLAPEKNDINPPTSLSEKLEAAIGLCRMNLKLVKYQPDATVYLVGKVLTEFAAKYREDEPNVIKGGSDRPPLMPWKYHAKRLELALQEMAAQSTQGNFSKDLNTLVQNSRGILLKIYGHGQVADQDVTGLVGVVTGMWPQAPALSPYQGVTNPNSQIQMPAKQGS
jgi:hypothetical protein